MSGSGIGIGRGRDMPRARGGPGGGPGAELGVQGVAIQGVRDYQAAISRLERSLNGRDPDPELLTQLNVLATNIHDEDDEHLNQKQKKEFLTALDRLERNTILKQIKGEHAEILTLFQNAQPMTYEQLTPADKTSLQQLILSFAPEILNEELDHIYPPGEAESNINKAAKLAELLGIYMNLLERLLPTFFGALPADPTRLFIPNTTRDAQGNFEDIRGVLKVDLAMSAAYKYMVQIKTIGQGASAIARVVVPGTFAEFFAKFATFGLIVATLQVTCPTLFDLLNGVATGAGLTVSDIRWIMSEAFSNIGYINAFLLWCNENSEQITELAWKIFSKTLGRRLPEAPPPPPNDFKALFGNLSNIDTAARRERLTGVRPEFRFDLPTGLDCIVHLTRVACVAQAEMTIAVVRQVPKALQYLYKTCGRFAQGGVQMVSRYAVGLESTADAVSPDTYKSFGDFLSKLAEDAKYDTLHDDADFKRRMALMQLNNPNPHSLNEARIRASLARDRQEFGGRFLDNRLQSESMVADADDDSLKDLTLTPEHGSVRQLTYDPAAAGGVGAHGEMETPDNATFESNTTEGRKPSKEAQDLLGTIHMNSDDESDHMGNGGADASGGRSRSRKRSVSKRTRRKGIAKKQKSKKNKRQSRRKVRRASSRKSRK